METRKLGNSDLDLSIIGLGTWAIGGGDWQFGWGPQEEKDSIQSIHEALGHGINWIDTAAVYGHGLSEEVVGKALKQWDEPIIVATKCGLLPGRDGGVRRSLRRDSIFNEVERSLKRLQIETIDLYQIHWPIPDEQIEEGFDALLELQRQGKIHHVGVSNFDSSQLARINARGNFVSLQPPYSLLKRSIELSILPWCREHKVGVIAYSPLQCGLLTGKVNPKWVQSLPDNDWRKNFAPHFKEPLLSKCLNLVEELKKIAESRDLSLIELSLKWLLEQPGITSAIVGARKPGQISEVVSATSSAPLGQELCQTISKLAEKFVPIDV